MNELNEKLQALRTRFTQALPERLSAIEAELAKIRNGELESIRHLQRLFHTLTGTAGTYGLPAISALSAQAEETCDGLEAGDNTEALAAVESLLPAMRQLAEPPAAAPRFALAAVPSPAQKTPGRILCVEDDPEQADYLCTVLRAGGYEVLAVGDARSFRGAVEEFRPDLVLLDLTLGDGSGIDLARQLRGEELWGTLPIVFATGSASLQSRLEGMDVGGDDYLVKPIGSELLLGTVAGRLKRSRAMKRLIERDELTGVCRQGAFSARMQAAIDEHARRGTPFCLVMLDIDHFKSVNDRHGHVVGDYVLSAFGRFLRANVRAEDAVGRCGGEEFGLLLAGLPLDQVQTLTERLLERFGHKPHAARHGEQFLVTFSAGVALLGDGDTATSWKQRADDALYAAKRGGRARVEAA